MAANIAILSQGSSITVGTGKTPINDFLGFNAPGAPSPEIDTTHLGSVAKEAKAGLPDLGQATMNLHANDEDPGQSALRTLAISGAEDEYEITLSNGAKYAFNAVVLQFSMPSFDRDTVLTRTVVLRLSGDYNFTAAP